MMIIPYILKISTLHPCTITNNSLLHIFTAILISMESNSIKLVLAAPDIISTSEGGVFFAQPPAATATDACSISRAQKFRTLALSPWITSTWPS